jgi:serine/threonine-protein kinase
MAVVWAIIRSRPFPHPAPPVYRDFMADRLGKYEVLHELGKGAMGVVYEGYDPIIDRRLAIKTVKLPDAEDFEAQDALARFKREAQAAGRLSHPNIVGVFDYGETPEIAYIVMEFVDGTTLKHIVDKKERFELPEIVRLMDGVLTGLQFSHDRGVVHRDIKPANIMLTKSGEVKIADFGIARIESSSMTQAGTMLGTPSYMSPEQFMGQTVDSRTDIYSCGVMLYQLLTGDKPFEGSLTAMMHKVLNTEPLPPSALSVTVPRSFDAVVQRAMAKRPDERFATAADFAAALKEALIPRPAPEIGLGVAEYAEGDATMVASSRPATQASPPPAARAAVAAPMFVPEKKPPPMALIGGGIALAIAVLGGGAYMLLGHSSPPAAVPAAPATPTPAPAAPPMSAAQRESVLTGTLASLPCTLLSGTDSGAQPAISGLAGAGAPQEALTAALASLPAAILPATSVQTIDGPYCNALDTIRPYHSLFASPGTQLGLSLSGGKTTLYAGDKIAVINKMPGFSGYLETDYFSSDGTVFHLYQEKTGATAEPAGNMKTMVAGTAAAPFGTDMIIAIASSTPLFTEKRMQVENDSDYLPALRTALQDVATAGASVSVAAIPVVTLPK